MNKFLYKDGTIKNVGGVRCRHVYNNFSGACIYCSNPKPEQKYPLKGIEMPVTRTDVNNKFGIIKKGDDVMITGDIPKEMARHDALILAAWLVRLTDITGDDFSHVLRVVRGK